MRIAICDDDKLWCEKAKQLLDSFFEQNGEKTEILSFYTSEELLDYQGSSIDLVFMDIELKEKGEGIITAGRLNEKWKHCQIVYLTNYLFYATEVYHTKHVFYVLKEQFEKKLGEIFHKIYHEQEQFHKKYTFFVKGGLEISVLAKDIYYFEREKRMTKMTTAWGVYEIWDKIEDIYQKLPTVDFVRCHNSYIAYFPYVREIRKDDILMEDGAALPISRNYRKNVKQAFSRWALTQII